MVTYLVPELNNGSPSDLIAVYSTSYSIRIALPMRTSQLRDCKADEREHDIK